LLERLVIQDEIIINKGEASKCLILRKGLLGMVINSKG
jgi:hypothetical protein